MIPKTNQQQWFPGVSQLTGVVGLLLAELILSTRLATLIHEILGHAGMGWWLGLKIETIYISLFGGGKVVVDSRPIDQFSSFLFSCSGMALNLITGMVTLWISNRLQPCRLLVGLFLSLFSLVSILGTLAYLTTGLYYGYGDPVSWILQPVHPAFINGLWGAFLALVVPFSYLCFRTYMRFQDQMFPLTIRWQKMVITVVSLGTASILYGILFLSTHQSLASLDASHKVYLREKTTLIQVKRARLFDQIRKHHPDWSPDAIAREVDQTPIEISPEEIPRRIPIVPVLVLLCGTGALLSVFRPDFHIPFASRFPSRIGILAMMGLAMVTIWGLCYLDGLIYRG